jgi:hypothetical protein
MGMSFFWSSRGKVVARSVRVKIGQISMSPIKKWGKPFGFPLLIYDSGRGLELQPDSKLHVATLKSRAVVAFVGGDRSTIFGIGGAIV